MEFLWSKGLATAETVREGLATERLLKDSTVRTVLRRLEAKRYVQHKPERRRFVYFPLVRSRQFAAEAACEILNKYCHGSLEELLAAIVDDRFIRGSELHRLARKIGAKKRNSRKA
jgi:BlaI family penicillinase repressor